MHTSACLLDLGLAVAAGSLECMMHRVVWCYRGVTHGTGCCRFTERGWRWLLQIY